ncbi:uncharacterized protein LOC116187748 [Punica granatum]|uniref:Uncharacterized protein LOC116187748 n=1 Tax=Punica granatum TaxID=22663 RepID=A0A6P8BP88_PUNGR|nr:uncharacterized protein LOC116187748 [Punica granatum]
MQGKGIWSTGLTLLSRVADVIGSEGWRWKPRKTAMLSVIQEKVSHIIPGDREDRIIWSAHPKGILTVARTWDFIRDKMAEVEWHRLLWTSPLIPRHCFISWLAIRGRLSTLDRISRWKKDISSSCVLCGTEEEKRDHIFFSCPFSTDVWVKILLMNGENRSCRLSWHAYIYNIWKARNDRTFHDIVALKEKVLACVKQAMKCRIMGMPKLDSSIRTEEQRLLLAAWSKAYSAKKKYNEEFRTQ